MAELQKFSSGNLTKWQRFQLLKELNLVATNWIQAVVHNTDLSVEARKAECLRITVLSRALVNDSKISDFFAEAREAVEKYK